MSAEHDGSEREPARIPVFAVIRFDPSQSEPAEQAMVWEVLADLAEAELEIAHLNAEATPGSAATYFVAATHFYPEGRHAALGAWTAPARPTRANPAGPPAPAERLEGEWGFMVEAVEDGGAGAGSI